MSTVRFLLFAGLIGSAAQGFASGACAAAEGQGKVELVQSVPEQTELGVAGLRLAKDVWLELAKNAVKSIDLGEFYFSSKPDKPTEPVLKELENAGRRGVKIRVLVSNALLKEDMATIDRLRAIPGLELRIYNLHGLTGGILHAKYWVVDGEEIYVGSQNFDWRSLIEIHETGVRVRDARIAGQLEQIFEIDWKIAATGKAPQPIAPPAAPSRAPDIELVASPQVFNPGTVRPAIGALVELLTRARRTIRFQLLDYSPVAEKGVYWPEIDTALRAAAVRGVKVEMLVSNWNTEKPAVDHLKSLSLIPGIELKIATIPELSSGHLAFARVIHTKMLIVDDDVLWVGTSNWSRGYFYASRNVELIFRDSALADTGLKIFGKVWESSYAKPIEVAREYPVPRKGE